MTFDEGRKRSSPYSVKIWNLAYGGNTIRPQTETIEINVFDNDREIFSLPVFPVRFKDEADGGATKRKLIERGQKYVRYSKRPTFLQYSGKGLRAGKSVRPGLLQGDRRLTTQYKRARVVVEHASKPWEEDDDFTESPHYPPTEDDEFGSSMRVARCECQECREVAIVEDVHAMPFNDYRNIDPRDTGMLTSHQYMLMSSHMFAFILKDRTYGK